MSAAPTHAIAGMARLTRCLIIPVLISAAAAAGCSDINLQRFASATRIDVRLTPVRRPHEQPFAAAYQRLRMLGPGTCDSINQVESIRELIISEEDEWIERWGVFLESPAVSLSIYEQDEFLGTIKVYDTALGHAGNRIRNVQPQQTAHLVNCLCDCMEMSKTNRSNPSG